MNLSKTSIFNVFILFTLIFSSSSALAVDAISTKSLAATPVNPQRVPVATVNIVNARIISQKDNTFNIAFGLSNKVGLQTGVKYGIQLVPDGAKYIADEKVYDESLTLAENTTVQKQITYVAPSYFGGSYELLIVSNNESSFPFGVVSLGKVKLSATKKGIEIVNDSCYLQVEGEKGSPHYTLVQSVDVNASELLKLTCNAVNNTSTPMSMVPFFETRYFSSYGKLATQVGGDYKQITFAKNEKKNFSVLLPKGDAPQFYNLKVSLMNSDSSSNAVSVHYIVRGVSGTLQKLSLSKDYYSAGDKGDMSIIWSASAGNFARSGLKTGALPAVSLNANITNQDGRECISPIDQSLKRDFRNPQTKISFDVKATCLNPKVSATLSDDKGNVLDQKDFTFKSSGSHATGENSKPISMLYVAIIIIALLAIILLGVYMKKRKSSNATIQ